MLKDNIQNSKKWIAELPPQGKILIAIVTLLVVTGTAGLTYLVTVNPNKPKPLSIKLEQKDLAEAFILANKSEINANIINLKSEAREASKGKDYYRLAQAYVNFSSQSKDLMQRYEDTCFIIYPDMRKGKAECSVLSTPNKSNWSLYEIEYIMGQQKGEKSPVEALYKNYVDIDLQPRDFMPKMELIVSEY